MWRVGRTTGRVSPRRGPGPSFGGQSFGFGLPLVGHRATYTAQAVYVARCPTSGSPNPKDCPPKLGPGPRLGETRPVVRPTRHIHARQTPTGPQRRAQLF